MFIEFHVFSSFCTCHCWNILTEYSNGFSGGNTWVFRAQNFTRNILTASPLYRPDMHHFPPEWASFQPWPCCCQGILSASARPNTHQLIMNLTHIDKSWQILSSRGGLFFFGKLGKAFTKSRAAGAAGRVGMAGVATDGPRCCGSNDETRVRSKLICCETRWFTRFLSLSNQAPVVTSHQQHKNARWACIQLEDSHAVAFETARQSAELCQTVVTLSI